MSNEEQFLGRRRAPRCYSRPACQASTSLPRDCQTSAALLVLLRPVSSPSLPVRVVGSTKNWSAGLCILEWATIEGSNQ